MTKISTFQPVEVFDEDGRRSATANVIDHVMQVLFFYFEENEEGLDTDEGMDEFVQYLWSISCSALAVTGMRLVGVDAEGRYVATFNPSASVKEFLQNSDIGKDDDVFFEDVVETNDGPSFFEGHDDRFVADN
jgi:hypothetical protein